MTYWIEINNSEVLTAVKCGKMNSSEKLTDDEVEKVLDLFSSYKRKRPFSELSQNRGIT